MKLIPSVNHGMWEVDGYRASSEAIYRRSPLWRTTIRQWILGLVGQRPGQTPGEPFFGREP